MNKQIRLFFGIIVGLAILELLSYLVSYTAVGEATEAQDAECYERFGGSFIVASSRLGDLGVGPSICSSEALVYRTSGIFSLHLVRICSDRRVTYTYTDALGKPVSSTREGLCDTFIARSTNPISIFVETPPSP